MILLRRATKSNTGRGINKPNHMISAELSLRYISRTLCLFSPFNINIKINIWTVLFVLIFHFHFFFYLIIFYSAHRIRMFLDVHKYSGFFLFYPFCRRWQLSHTKLQLIFQKEEEKKIKRKKYERFSVCFYFFFSIFCLSFWYAFLFKRNACSIRQQMEKHKQNTKNRHTHTYTIQ